MKSLLSYEKTTVLEVRHAVLEQHGLRLLVKREDLNHPFVSGNKWWKLKYNVEQAILKKHHTLLTYGGAFSNHIFATAAAARELNLKSIGIIRGEETLPLNPTLLFARQCGMDLHYISRSAYRDINSPSHFNWLDETFGEYYRMPEGGTNEYAIQGCEEFGKIVDETACDFVCLPVGTGGTMAGLIKSVAPSKKILGFSTVRNGEFLRNEIMRRSGGENSNWELLTEYSYGGYAKRHPLVSSFISAFFQHTDIPLDFVYTGKMMCAVFDQIEKGHFKRGSTILAIHTGGLQGHSS